MSTSHMIPFFFQSRSEIRVHIDEGGNLWFVAKDVSTALGYPETSNAARLFSHIPDEWKGVNPIHTLGGEQRVTTLSEQGLYFFLARSDKPKALPFQKWLAGEVLPSIRKTGAYGRASSSLCFFPSPIPCTPGRSRIASKHERHVLIEPLYRWWKLVSPAYLHMDLEFLKAVVARAAGVEAYTRLPVGDLPRVKDWLEARVAEIEAGEAPYTVDTSPALPPAEASSEAAALADLRRELIVIEAAIEGADMGEKELQEALACKVLEVINALEPLTA